MIGVMKESNEPKRPNFPARGVTLGLFAGALVGLGQLGWDSMSGPVKNPEAYPVFCSMVGLLTGLHIGLVYHIWKEPKRTTFLEGFTVAVTIGILIGLGQIAWYRFTGQWIDYPAIDFVYLSLFGLIAGVFVGLICLISSRRSVRS